MFAYAWRQSIFLCSIFFALLGKLSGSSVQFSSELPDYNAVLVKYKAWAESGLTYTENQTFPHQAEFVVKDTDQTRNHSTTILARSFYTKDGQKQIVNEQNCVFKHLIASHEAVPQTHFYLDIDKSLYRPKIQKVEYVRPALSLLGLAELKYSTQHAIFAGQAVNPCALVIEEANQAVKNPLLKYYRIESEHQRVSPYLYSNGENFHLTTVVEAKCRHSGSDKVFTFSYIVPTAHVLTFKPGARLKITQGALSSESSLGSAFTRGLYRKDPSGTWIKINAELKAAEPNTSYTVVHPDETSIDEIHFARLGDANKQVLQTLTHSSFIQDISGIHFGGREFNQEEQVSLGEVLTHMPQLTKLNLAIAMRTADYNALVPALFALPGLRTLNVTNCGLSQSNIDHLQKRSVSYNLGAENGFPFFLSGFSNPEGTHRWTAGCSACVQLPVVNNQRKFKKITFLDTGGVITEQHTQRMIVHLNDTQVAEYLYDIHHPGHTIEICIPEQTDQAKITFELPNAIAPAALNINTDVRLLGVRFNQVQLSYPITIINTSKE
jgi:hypothetical protein